MSEVAPAPVLANTKPVYWDEACRVLRSRDAVIGAVMERCGPVHLLRRGDPFQTLARAIVGQQISVKAAQAVWQRFAERCGEVTPQRVARMRTSTALACGFSQRKAEYVKDLASHFVRGRIDPAHWDALDDESLIEQLVEVRGIGRWTAEMFLIFNLQRPDVFPVDDLGILRAIGIHYRDASKVSRDEAKAIAERWRPWRTVASWYLWRSLDPLPVEH